MATDFWNNTSSAPGPGVAAPPPTTFQKYVNQGMAYNQPGFLQSQLGTNAGYRNLGYGQAGYGLDQSGLQLGYQSDQRDLALQQGQNGIDLRAANRQPQLLDQLLGLDNREFDVQRADAGLQYKGNTEDLRSAATAQGAMLTSGRKSKESNLYAGLVNQMSHIGIGQEKNTLNAAEQKAQAQDRIDALNMTAGRLGMKGDELKSMLDNQLGKLGLNHAMSVDDILDGIANNDLQSKQLLMNILQQAGQYATAGK